MFKQLIFDCRKMFVSEEEEDCFGTWLLIDDSDSTQSDLSRPPRLNSFLSILDCSANKSNLTAFSFSPLDAISSFGKSSSSETFDWLFFRGGFSYDETFQKVLSLKETPLSSVEKVEVGQCRSAALFFLRDTRLFQVLIPLFPRATRGH